MSQESKPNPPATGEEDPPITFVGRDEMNIAEFPITLLSDRAPRGQNEIEFHDKIFDSNTHREIVRTLTITTPEKYGLPTSTDDDVLLALLQLTKQQNNFSRPEVSFNRLQLIEMLGWADKGSSYTRIAQSLNRWASTYLEYRNAWWDNKERRWTNGGFHIVDSFEINDGRLTNGKGNLFRSHATWGKVFFKSCQAGYLKSLDYHLYVALDFHTSKRMYRFLDKRFYHKQELAFELRDFAFEHIGLSRTYAHNGKIKEKLQPAIEELEAIGFLETLSKDARYRKEGRVWMIYFKKAQAAQLKHEEPSPAKHPLVKELITRGVTELTACELVQQYPAKRIAAKVDVFDWLATKADKRIQQSPAGYLVESIRRDYMAPKGYVPKAERERQEADQRREKQKAREERVRQAEEEAREQAERAAIQNYWDSLSEAEQTALDEQAQVAADPKALENARAMPPLLRMYKKSLREDYIRKLLAENRTCRLDRSSTPDS